MSDDDEGAYDSHGNDSGTDTELTIHTREKIDTKNIYDDDGMYSSIKKHVAEKIKNNAENARKYDKMEHYLECGFNLLVYGVGSKRDILQKFCQDRVHMPKMIVNGYHSGTTIKSILNSITKFMNQTIFRKKNEKKYKSQAEQIDDIKKYMNRFDEAHKNMYLVIVIHSFDMGQLK